MGKVSLSANVDGTMSDVTLNDVLYIPELKVNLFSTTKAVVCGGARAILEGKSMTIQSKKDDEVVAVGKYVPSQQLYILDCTVSKPEVDDKCFAAKEVGSTSYTNLMHKR